MRSILCTALVPAIVTVLWCHAQYSNASMERAVRLVSRGDIRLLLARVAAEQAAQDAEDAEQADRKASDIPNASANANVDTEPVSLLDPDAFAP